MPSGTTGGLTTATPAGVVRVILRRPHHSAATTSCSRPSIVPLGFTDIGMAVHLRPSHHLVHIEHSELWVLLSLVNHGAHLCDKGLHLLLGALEFIPELPIGPLESAVLLLQLLLRLQFFGVLRGS